MPFSSKTRGNHQFLIASAAFAALFVLLSVPSVQAEAGGQCTFFSQRIQCGSQTCDKELKVCRPCEDGEDAECGQKSMGCREGKCVLLPLSSVFDVLTLVAPLVAFLVCAIAVVAGIGGGGILVPLYFAVLDLPLLNAVALSQATIAGQSFFNVCLLLSRQHPKHKSPNPTRPVINYEYLCLMLPISLVGTMLGNLLSQVSPNWMRIVMLWVLLGYILIRVIKRLLKQRKDDQEKQSLLKKDKEAEVEAAAVAAVIEAKKKKIKEISPTTSSEDYGGTHSINLPDHPQTPQPQGELLPQYPKRWFGFMALVFVLLFFSNLVRGKTLDIVDCGSGYFWGIILGCVLYNCGLFGVCYNVLSKRRTQELAGEVPEGSIPFKWNKMTTIAFPLASVFAGAAASMLGIGGGLVLSFLLYEAGMVPEEASATSGMATFLVATSSATQFVLQKQLRWDYGMMVFTAGVCSTFVGQFVFNKQIRARGWNFLILGSLAFVIVGSMVSLTAVGIYNTYETMHHDGSLGFGTLCRIAATAPPVTGHSS